MSSRNHYKNRISQGENQLCKRGNLDVFIKLNWSAPKDATWVAFNNNLKCSSLSQLFLLLKSSDFIAHDLTQPYSECDDNIEGDNYIENIEYNLVLRQWIDINPGTEFR